MTHGDVNTFAASLVEMALATKRVPELEAERDELQRELSRAKDHIAHLEVRAHQRNTEIDTLHARIRELEVARDDAELRFLEADDARATVVRTLRNIMGEAHSAVEAVEPTPVPAAVVQPSPIPLVDGPLMPQGQPVDESGQSTGFTVDPLPGSETSDATATSETQSQGQSDPGFSAPIEKADSTGSVPGTVTNSVDASTAEEAPATPVPFAAAQPSQADSSPNVGDPNATTGNAGPTPAPTDPEPTTIFSDDWWSWHKRTNPSAYAI